MASPKVTTTSRYLTFRLAEKIYAVDIGKVREVLDFTTVIKVPRTVDFLRGVINLRSSVVPVVDLRLKFGMSATEKTVNTCVIIMDVTVDGDTSVLGCLADAVQEVIDLEPEQVSSAPKTGRKLRSEFITGVGRRHDHFVILLDIDRVFSADELAIMEAGRTEAAPRLDSGPA